MTVGGPCHRPRIGSRCGEDGPWALGGRRGSGERRRCGLGGTGRGGRSAHAGCDGRGSRPGGCGRGPARPHEEPRPPEPRLPDVHPLEVLQGVDPLAPDEDLLLTALQVAVLRTIHTGSTEVGEQVAQRIDHLEAEYGEGVEEEYLDFLDGLTSTDPTDHGWQTIAWDVLVTWLRTARQPPGRSRRRGARAPVGRGAPGAGRTGARTAGDPPRRTRRTTAARPRRMPPRRSRRRLDLARGGPRRGDGERRSEPPRPPHRGWTRGHPRADTPPRRGEQRGLLHRPSERRDCRTREVAWPQSSAPESASQRWADRGRSAKR